MRNPLELENKELLETLQELIAVTDLIPGIQMYSDYKKQYQLYEIWKKTKKILDKYTKEKS